VRPASHVPPYPYAGEWIDGRISGFGTLTYADGDKYIGMWIDGKMNGQVRDHSVAAFRPAATIHRGGCRRRWLYSCTMEQLKKATNSDCRVTAL